MARNLGRILVQAASARYVHTTSALEKRPSKSIPRPVRNRVTCTLIPGDGIGPEMAAALQEVFKAADVPVDFEQHLISEVNPELSSDLEDAAASIAKHQLCIKGILGTPDFRVDGLRNLNMRLRNKLDLYANVVHIRSLPGVKTRFKDVDIVIIREQTEGEYSSLEHESVPGVVECLKIITQANSKRIAKFAFDYATKNDRKKVTAIHKANIMKVSDGMFLRSCEEMAKLYPRIQFANMIVDNTTMQLVAYPDKFDVLVTPNLYGSIVNHVISGMVGGAGVVAGYSYSSDAVVFEPGVRHKFKEGLEMGKNLGNPTAFLLCGANLLHHINMQYYSDKILSAISKVLLDGKIRTKDLGGTSSTQEYTQAVIANLK